MSPGNTADVTTLTTVCERLHEGSAQVSSYPETCRDRKCFVVWLATDEARAAPGEKPPDVFAAGVRDSRLSRTAADVVKVAQSSAALARKPYFCLTAAISVRPKTT
jgi:hypothetical protein